MIITGQLIHLEQWQLNGAYVYACTNQHHTEGLPDLAQATTS